MLGTEVEHFLGFGDAADARAGKAAALHQQREGGDRLGVFRRADQAERAVALQEVEIGVDVVVGRDAVEDEIERLGMRLHLVGVLRDDDLMGTQPLAVFDLGRRSGEQHDVGAERLGELDAHMAEAAQADDADLLARSDLPVTQR